MSIANTLLFERIKNLQAPQDVVTQKAYVGEAEHPFKFFCWGGSLPSDDGFGLFLDEKCILKKLVYYNLGTESEFKMSLVLKNYDKNIIIKSFEVSGRTSINLEDVECEGMIGLELVSSNEPEESFSRHRVILYTQ